MPENKPENFEYSMHLEQAEETKKDAAEIDGMIAETRAHIEELKEDRQGTVEGSEIIRELGYDPESEIAEMDRWIKEAEQALVGLERMKAEFNKIAGEFERLHQKAKELLEGHNPNKTI